MVTYPDGLNWVSVLYKKKAKHVQKSESLLSNVVELLQTKACCLVCFPAIFHFASAMHHSVR